MGGLVLAFVSDSALYIGGSRGLEREMIYLRRRSREHLS